MSSQSSPQQQQQQQQQQQAPSNSLDEHFASFAARVEKIDEAIDVNDHQSLVTARGNLAEIILELEQLHIDEVGYILHLALIDCLDNIRYFFSSFKNDTDNQHLII
jgi:hypothetical protein